MEKKIKNIVKVPLSQITIREGKLIECTHSNIDEMVKSIERNNGEILQPIIIDQNYVLIDGEVRLEAAKKLGHEYINCIVSDIESESQRLNQEVDLNLVRRMLTTLEIWKLDSARKKDYELEHPTSTKEFKSRNNALPEEKRVDVEPRYEDVEAEKLGVSSKTIENGINIFEKINEKNSELIDRLIKNEKSTKNRVQKAELKKISELSKEQTEDLLELIKLEAPLKKGDLKNKIIQVENTEQTKNLNEQDLFHQVFLHDLSKLISDNEKFTCLKEKINVDINSVSEYKKSKKLDFTNEIKFILENIK